MVHEGGHQQANGRRAEIRDYQDKIKEYAKQSQRLAHLRSEQTGTGDSVNAATKAVFVTPHDPVVVTAEGGRLPVVPVEEAVKLNNLKDESEGRTPRSPPHSTVRLGVDGSYHGTQHTVDGMLSQDEEENASLSNAIAIPRTNPLFPPLPLYGPPSVLRTVQCWFFRVTSFFLSLAFLLLITLNAAIGAVPVLIEHSWQKLLLRDPDASRPFHREELRRRKERRARERAWEEKRRCHDHETSSRAGEVKPGQFVPTEGGPDPLICDARYYARRVGLDMEIIEVQTEDGFIIELWHLFDPAERPNTNHKQENGPRIFSTKSSDSILGESQKACPDSQKKYPVLMIHGLLQSAGAFCCNGDDSLAFFLAKSGYDVWLGNNRCGFEPRHTILQYGDPRMWAWNIRQMGVMDLPAMISRVLTETGFPKLALIAHSQGTTQTFVALAKEQRPDIGEKISVFCALAPAVYAGPLIGKIYFTVIRTLSPAIFRLIFGIHAFIPLMMQCHKLLPGKFYSQMGYTVFSFLFNWTDVRWERDLRDRMFQFAPVFVSAESMRWWLGRECFAKQRCILATREAGRLEDQEDEEDDEVIRKHYIDKEPHVSARRRLSRNLSSFHCQTIAHLHHDSTRGKYAWYDKRFPPLALWVAGNDDLVDGRRLLRRFDRGREPDVRIVHKKIIEGYEHLDVIWAMDALEEVGKEVREVIWQTAGDESQAHCRIPVGCDEPLDQGLDIVPQPTDFADRGKAIHSGRRLRMASISEATPPKASDDGELQMPTQIDASHGEWTDELLSGSQSNHHHEKTGTRSRGLSEIGFIGIEETADPFG